MPPRDLYSDKELPNMSLMSLTSQYLQWLRTQRAALRYAAIGAVLLLGTGLRFYRIEAQLLRNDELFTADLVQRGVVAIWRTGFREHSLPLPNLLFWLG